MSHEKDLLIAMQEQLRSINDRLVRFETRVTKALVANNPAITAPPAGDRGAPLPA